MGLRPQQIVQEIRLLFDNVVTMQPINLLSRQLKLRPSYKTYFTQAPRATAIGPLPVTTGGLRLCPIEVTVRDGGCCVTISCAINDKGVTNAQFKARLKSLGYDDAKSLQGVRRIRGGHRG